jgi:hypothetical protein
MRLFESCLGASYLSATSHRLDIVVEYFLCEEEKICSEGHIAESVDQGGLVSCCIYL